LVGLNSIRKWFWLERAQWFESDKLKEIQNRKLNEIVSHAYREVPFYRERYANARVEPSAVRNLESLQQLPIITKEDIRDVPLDERTARNVDRASCYVRTTSGSTGIPLTVLEEPAAASHRAALWLRRLSTFGAGPLDRICIVVAEGGRRGQNPLLRGTGGLSGYIVRQRIKGLSLGSDIFDHVRFISRWKPQILVAPASYYRIMLRIAEDRGCKLTVRVAIANAETLDGLTRKLIRDQLHTENVFEVYGAAEVGSIGWECPSHAGIHVNAESLVIEVLRGGESVGEGEPGEICVTNLYRKATPMIRYLLGDVVKFLDSDCPCGRELPLIREIQGRVVDFILTREGAYVSPSRIMSVLEVVPGVAQYKVVQESDGSIELRVKVTDEPRKVIADALESRCSLLFGSTPVRIQFTDRIRDSESSKFRPVESHLTTEVRNVLTNI